jgi:hypothetical protein
LGACSRDHFGRHECALGNKKSISACGFAGYVRVCADVSLIRVSPDVMCAFIVLFLCADGRLHLNQEGEKNILALPDVSFVSNCMSWALYEIKAIPRIRQNSPGRREKKK